MSADVGARAADLRRAKIEHTKALIDVGLELELQKKREKLCRKNGGHYLPSGSFYQKVCEACGRIEYADDYDYVGY